MKSSIMQTKLKKWVYVCVVIESLTEEQLEECNSDRDAFLRGLVEGKDESDNEWVYFTVLAPTEESAYIFGKAQAFDENFTGYDTTSTVYEKEELVSAIETENYLKMFFGQ